MSANGNILIAPSLLAADFGKLASEIQEIEELGADWLHIDVMDGAFVPPITFGDNMVRLAKMHSSLLLDVHLMIENPDKHIEAFHKAGADRLIVHIEACKNPRRVLEEIKKAGLSSGITLNPDTPVSEIEEILEYCDLALVMTVNPGWGGQGFIETCLPKIEQIRKIIEGQNLKTLIEVDGGVNADTGKRCIDAGANVLVAGSYIFGSTDRKAAIESLRG